MVNKGEALGGLSYLSREFGTDQIVKGLNCYAKVFFIES